MIIIIENEACDVLVHFCFFLKWDVLVLHSYAMEKSGAPIFFEYIYGHTLDSRLVNHVSA